MVPASRQDNTVGWRKRGGIRDRMPPRLRPVQPQSRAPGSYAPIRLKTALRISLGQVRRDWGMASSLSIVRRTAGRDGDSVERVTYQAARPTAVAGRPAAPATGRRLPSPPTPKALMAPETVSSAYRYWLLWLSAMSVGWIAVRPVCPPGV